MNKRIKDIESIIKNKKIKAYGIDIELTDEQVKEFEKMIEPKYKNPYERVKKDEFYWTIYRASNGFEAIKERNENKTFDYEIFENGNGYNDEEFAKQVAMAMILQQKLRKFTYDNGWSEELWKDKDLAKYCIYYNTNNNQLEICATNYFKQKDIYYKTPSIAQRAIDEIIEPFMKENPTFKW